MTLQNFFKIPAVKLAVHILIIAGLVANIWQFYRIWEINQKIESENRQLQILQQQTNDARNQKDYFSSDLYKEKYSKQDLNFKKKGEEVIDTSLLENVNDTSGSTYIPTANLDNNSNVQKWLNYLFGE
jgi:hypothetical protein